MPCVLRSDQTLERAATDGDRAGRARHGGATLAQNRHQAALSCTPTSFVGSLLPVGDASRAGGVHDAAGCRHEAEEVAARGRSRRSDRGRGPA